MIIKSNQKAFAPVIVLVALALVVGGFLLYQKTGKPFVKQNIPATSPNKNVSVGMVLNAITTRDIDPKTGKGGVEVTTFSTKDPIIFVVMQVNKPVKGTKFEYIRYYKGKYVDHKSLETTKDGIDYVSFSWKLKSATSGHLPGVYKVKLYTNGNFEREVTYMVR